LSITVVLCLNIHVPKAPPGCKGFDEPEAFIVTCDLPFQIRKSGGQLLVEGQRLAQADKGSHDLDVHLDGAPAPEHAREHGHPLFSEGVGEVPPAAPGA